MYGVVAYTYLGHVILTMCIICLSLLCFDFLQFFRTNISQGSVATALTCGGICSDRFIANLLLPCEYFLQKSVNIW